MNLTSLPSKHADCARLHQRGSAMGGDVWDWDCVTDRIDWAAPSHALLGYTLNAFPRNLATWKNRNRMYPEDRVATGEMVTAQLSSSGGARPTRRGSAGIGSLAPP